MAAPRLSGVEALRGVAALGVVFYHAARHLNRAYAVPWLIGATRFGHAGVDLFFVVSGFIILFVHRRDVGQPACWRHYAWRRFSRVMPTYWVALGLTLLISAAGGHAPPSPTTVLWSASLLPSFGKPLLGVAWTLQYEVVFYSLFGLLIVSVRAGLVTMAIWLAAILSNCAGWSPAAAVLPPSLFDACNLEFFLGMAVAWRARSTVGRPVRVLAAGLVLFALSALAENAGILDGYAPLARLTYGIPSALLVLGVVASERSGQLRVADWLGALGGSSYSIYLFQFVFIGTVWQVWLAAGLHGSAQTWVIYLLLVGAAAGGGLVTRRLVERPLMQLTCRLSIPKPGVTAASPLPARPIPR